MTPIEIRIRFKSETGFPPTRGRTQEQQTGSCNYKGTFTNEYGTWLEDNNTNLRDEYHKETGLLSLKDNINRVTLYTNDYMEWLEERRCKENYYEFN